MLRLTTLAQPSNGAIADRLNQALMDGAYRELRAAVAYATTSGVRQLTQSLQSAEIARRWLIGIDWCRSEPAALEALDTNTSSEVRIFGGSEVVANSGCEPLIPFHPKTFLFSGAGCALLVSGSGNLSASGLRGGTEFDTIVEVSGPATHVELDTWKQLDRLKSWFDDHWTEADPWRTVADQYKPLFATRPQVPPTLDFGRPAGTRGFSAEELSQIAAATTMWIEAGTLTPATSDSPRHQLMMRPLTRVFFGFGSEQVPRKTSLGVVTLHFRGRTFTNLSIEHAHNSMDRLNLPAREGPSAARYDGKTLIFTKVADHDDVAFELATADKRATDRLRLASSRKQLIFTMPGKGREFGFV